MEAAEILGCIDVILLAPSVQTLMKVLSDITNTAHESKRIVLVKENSA